MGPLLAILLLAADRPKPVSSGAAPGFSPTKAEAPAQAFVRILSGARISLNADAEADGYRLNKARITVEDGSQRTAQLVEFQ